ncbi:hypothetical protein KIH86_19090 [Paenibacillus sp. HN-1]|uniref:hypothetical protein n=1 Tax=Paenibacillus TaxID=44249 RepID=UPI001CA9B3DC|nr:MULTISPECIES: hypothetical protein [Paenibacillus]MBY9082323.1 hypothetical protein [Paenibacillus sp. CGMCC 1.18879]MBY9086313.1 hypothetical protein [Paenibacillus sinensis]
MTRIVQLQQTCRCGGEMIIHMHTLIYKARVKIEKVPVFMCQSCFTYEPHPAVKADLASLLAELGEAPGRLTISFVERNEWAFVLNSTFNGYTGEDRDLESAVRQAVAERIDLLLDILRVATELSDKQWMNEIENRLLVLVPHYKTGVR